LTELLDNIKARVDRIDNIKVRTITATSRERKDALKIRAFHGKILPIPEAQELNGSITIDEVHDMSISDMIEKLEQMKLALKDEQVQNCKPRRRLEGNCTNIAGIHATFHSARVAGNSIISEKQSHRHSMELQVCLMRKHYSLQRRQKAQNMCKTVQKGLKYNITAESPMIPQGSTSAQNV